MMDYPRPLESVATDLDWLDPPPMFFGASVLEAYIDRREMLDEELRPTDDVDVVVHVGSGRLQVVVAAVEWQLREHGWKDDMRPNRRNQHAFVSPSDIPVDVVMDRLFPDDDWPVRASHSPEELQLPSGRIIHIPTPAFFLACKIAASRNRTRWEGTYYSHDLEDIAVLMAGCSRLLLSAKAGPPVLKECLSGWATELLAKQTPYGEAANPLVLDNAPRAADHGDLQTLLDELATLG